MRQASQSVSWCDLPGFGNVEPMGEKIDNPYSMEAVADRLRRTREALDLSQAEMARRLDLSPQAWWNVESGRAQFTTPMAVKLCQVFGLNFDWIYRGMEGPVPLPPAFTDALHAKKPPAPSVSRRNPRSSKK